MKVKAIGSNQTEITFESTGVTILVSYNQPVAALIPGQGYYRTKKFWSATTTCHINRWINPTATVQIVEQEVLDKLMGG